MQLRSYLTLLERLGVEHTYLSREFCCGGPAIEMAKPWGLHRVRLVHHE